MLFPDSPPSLPFFFLLIKTSGLLISLLLSLSHHTLWLGTVPPGCEVGPMWEGK